MSHMGGSFFFTHTDRPLCFATRELCLAPPGWWEISGGGLGWGELGRCGVGGVASAVWGFQNAPGCICARLMKSQRLDSLFNLNLCPQHIPSKTWRRTISVNFSTYKECLPGGRGQRSCFFVWTPSFWVSRCCCNVWSATVARAATDFIQKKGEKTHRSSALSFMQLLRTEGAMRRLLLSARRVSKATTVTPSQQQQHTVAAEQRARA